MNKLIQSSGLLIFLSFILTLSGYFFSKTVLGISVLFVWIAFIFLFFTSKNKNIVLILLFLSLILFLICLSFNFQIDYRKLFSINQYLLTLLIGVGFLRLIATLKKENGNNIGKKSFFKTYLGVHFFGSVINLSSLIIVADEMYKKAKLTNTQIILLTRAFSSDAYWSPFFVAFAAASTYASNLDINTILICGAFLSIIVFLLTYYEITNNNKLDMDSFSGYPLSFRTLILPFSLAVFVLLTNLFYPNIKVIVLIALFSFCITFFSLLLKNNISNLKNYILKELPLMKTELSLFLVAGIFGVLCSTILINIGFELPFDNFNWYVASIFLAIFILFSFVGIHPIITVVIVSDLITSKNDTLFAMMFLMAWATTVSTSPFSGLNLTLLARYNFDGKKIFQLNIKYALKMYFISVLVLFLLEKYLAF